MKIVMLLLFAVLPSWRVNLPTARIGQSYNAGLSKNLSGCAVNDSASLSPAVVHGVPAGLSIAGDGVISGMPAEQQAAAYEFGVACAEAKFVVRIKVLRAE